MSAEEEASSPQKQERGVPRRMWAIAIAALVALLGGGLYFATRGSNAETLEPAPQARRALDVVPAGATFIVTADLRALRASPLAAPYLGGDREVPGFGNIAKACGFDPIQAVDEIALVVPETGDNDFGIVAMGGFSDAALLDCATKIIQARGGRPVTSPIGGFRSVRDLTAPASGEIAVRPGGLLLLGGGAYLRTMIDAADGTIPTIRGDAAHEKLRAGLQGYETLQASLVLSKQQRATIADEIARAQGKAPAVLGAVHSAALGARLVGDKVALLLVVVSDEPKHSGDIRQLLEAATADASEGLASQLLGLAPLLARIKLEAAGNELRATLEVTVPELETVLEKALKVRALMDSVGTSPSAPQPSAPQPSAPQPSAPQPSAPQPSALPPLTRP